MKKRNKTPKERRRNQNFGKSCKQKKSKRPPLSEEEARKKFVVGFWDHVHGRKNKKGVGRHYAYVYARDGVKYKYLGLSTTKNSGRHTDHPLTVNPEPKNKESSYLRRSSSDFYTTFTKRHPDWRFDEVDMPEVEKRKK